MTDPRLALNVDFQRLPYLFMVEGLNRMFFGPFETSAAAEAWMARTGQSGVVHRLIEPDSGPPAAKPDWASFFARDSGIPSDWELEREDFEDRDVFGFKADQLESLTAAAFELLGKPEAEAQELARAILAAAERPISPKVKG
jgi:hypothetical protein